MQRSSTYQYQGLESAADFRLLAVRPRHEQTQSGFIDWQFQLQRFHRGNCPKYETTSYVWGTPRRDHAIELEDGALIAATTSVLEALPILAANCLTGYLWIDQICINQDDINERNMQVRIMGDIYKRCERVIIWLGVEDADPRLAKLISDVCLEARGLVPADSNGSKLTFKNAVAGLLSTSFRQEFIACAEAAADLYRRIWFKRAWVVQEAVLPNDSVVLAGSTKLDFDHIAEYASALVVMTSHIHRPDSGLTNLSNMNSARQEYRGWDRLAFHEVLSIRSSFVDATDNRDLVYAFLGFLDDDNVNITVDYNLSIEQVFTETAKAIIHARDDLDLFGCLRLTHTEGSLGTLASWVPDWTKKFESFPLSFGGHFSAARRHKCEPVFHDTCDYLELRGRIIDQVRYKAIPKITSSSASRRANIQVQLPFSAIIDSIGKSSISINKPVTRERLLKVFFADGISKVELDSHPLNPDKIDFLLTRYDAVAAADDDSKVLWDLFALEEYSGPLRTRRLFCTASGKLGLGSSATELGDQIAIIHGSKTPLILRSREGGKFRLVGQCYVEEIMYGEACIWHENEADNILLM